jgi:hypothetical protein
VLGVTFDLDDVVSRGATFIDSSGPVPIIVNGGNDLAENSEGIRIFFSFIIPGDGEASLVFVDAANDKVASLEVRWIVADAVDVSEPGVLALLGSGLAGLGWLRRRRGVAGRIPVQKSKSA